MREDQVPLENCKQSWHKWRVEYGLWGRSEQLVEGRLKEDETGDVGRSQNMKLL